jgi:hypothetical protein
MRRICVRIGVRIHVSHIGMIRVVSMCISMSICMSNIGVV